MTPQTITKWDYNWLHVNVSGFTGPNEKKVTKELDMNLAKLGTDGWELVSILPMTSAGSLTSVVYYFKRPLP